MKISRADNRNLAETRPIEFIPEYTEYAEGAVLVSAGKTRVLCTATVEESVPSWLKGQGKGWVTAEYSMLPRATHTRTRRERDKVSGRTHEIQRLIGRSLRACVDLKALGERQIIVDCDVLQADGGTRTASVNGACVALGIAIAKLAKANKVSSQCFHTLVGAISLGYKQDSILVDLDYSEDSNIDVDANFVMDSKGGIIEVQGTGEKLSFSPDTLIQMVELAKTSIASIHAKQRILLSANGLKI